MKSEFLIQEETIGKVLTYEKKLSEKIRECIRTKVVYVKSIRADQLSSLQAKGFVVIIK